MSGGKVESLCPGIVRQSGTEFMASRENMIGIGEKSIEDFDLNCFLQI